MGPLQHVIAELRGAVWGTWVNAVLASPLVPRPLRAALLRATGVPTRAWNIAPHCFFGGRDVTIGRGTFVSARCLFDPFAPITIGERVAVAMEVSFVTSSHEPGPPDRRAGAVTASPITVGDGCWIGARATILGGVSVGEGCVVAAGAVVTRSCEPHGLYAGVPARRVRDLDG
jgi:maltose O-acetyltransferase